MSDLIDRQAAIDAIEQMQMPIMRSEFPEEQFVFTGMSEALQAIKDLPSAQQWIPCSERLPEIGQSVLLSVGGMYSAEGCLREDGDWAQFRWDAIQRKDMVGAWKPLPEPYKGEQE